MNLGFRCMRARGTDKMLTIGRVLLGRAPMANLVYTPPLSVVPFLTSTKFANFVVGPVGSTKTTASLIKIGYEAAKIKASPDGIRRSRCAVIRNTRQMLWDTTIPDFLKWYPDGEAGILEKTNSKFLLKFDDVECEVLFRGLDDANDARRLLSLQLTFGVIDVYVHGEFGKSLSGQPVFRAFDRDTHVAKSTLNHIKLQTHPLIIGMDFGLTPACTINQIDAQGRLLTFADLTSEGMGTLRFCREKLKPLLANRFPGMNVLIIGDPAGQQRAQTDERSVFDILRQEGFRVVPAKTNSIVARVNSVDKVLTRTVDGKPGHLIDPCATKLIAALRGGYRYKIRQNGETDDKPEKNSHSHIADAHQYACLHADGNVTGDAWGRKAVEVHKSNYVWT
jgi:hypothetical protein